MIKKLNSSVGKKYLMAISGLGLVIFIIMHLAGNLTLLDPSGQMFNKYAKSLHDLGYLAIAAEFGLLGVFLIHIVLAFSLTKDNKSARPESYQMVKAKSDQNTWASRNMIITGIVLIAFLIYHVRQFRFGANLEEGYGVDIDGERARDLFRLVTETYSNPLHVFIYVSVMIFLGLHVRHGFWSLFQSLGLTYPNYSKPIRCLGLVIALTLVFGFMLLPIVIFVQFGG